MNQKISLKGDSELIRPLRKAVNEFIQVLISSFTIHQEEKGLTLEVEFDFESMSVWLKEGKNHIRHQLDPELIKQYQNELEGIMLGHDIKNWKHDNPAFPFRFGNGGTLPVIRYDDQDY